MHIKVLLGVASMHRKVLLGVASMHRKVLLGVASMHRKVLNIWGGFLALKESIWSAYNRFSLCMGNHLSLCNKEPVKVI